MIDLHSPLFNLDSPLVLSLVFVLGAAVGSFLNVCIYRLPLEKSILWPATSHCGHCLQAIRWYDNIPLVSYWLLGGRCRICHHRFSIRYFFVELLTALSLTGLYYLEVQRNIHRLEPTLIGFDRFSAVRLVFFAFHAVLLCFLLVATFSDLDRQIIPLSLTVTGTVVGLVGAIVWAWPWPYSPQDMAQTLPQTGWGGHPWLFVSRQPKTALYPWPVWWPLPTFLQPGGNWQSGLATGVGGILAGTLMLRAVRFLFGFGMGATYMEPPAPELAEQPRWIVARGLSWLQRVGGKALGLGDADLMMMAGAFLGWQPIVVAFFVSVFPGLFFALGQLVLRGTNVLPFGPALALGTIATFLGWTWIGPFVQPLFFDTTLLVVLGGVCGTLMLVFGYLLRVRRIVRP
jgi:leader peptidase (prepilin peptidase)/N-methyltransferase